MKNPELHMPDLKRLNLRGIPRFFNKYANFMFGIVVFSLLGYTAFQISQISTVAPDAAYVEDEIKKSDAKRIKLDTKTLDAVRVLNQLEIKPDTANPGKPDPFTP